MGLRLTPRSITLDDLELCKFEFSDNISGFRRFRTHVELEQFWHAFSSRGLSATAGLSCFVLMLSDDRASRRLTRLTTLLKMSLTDNKLGIDKINLFICLFVSSYYYYS